MEAAASLAEGLVDRAYVRDGATALHQHAQTVKSLLAQVRSSRVIWCKGSLLTSDASSWSGHVKTQRQLPTDGWSDVAIELLLHELALMDSQNFIGRREQRRRSNARRLA